MDRFSPETIAHAASHGIDADELPLICNGCSGGLSWVYALAGREISCEQCCHIHDIDYRMGGGFRDRARADRRLRKCAAKAGSFPPGWKGKVRRVWRWARAWVMWGVVRLCGGYLWG